MKTYSIAVVYSDATTFSQKYSGSKRDALAFVMGVKALYISQGKGIFLETIKLVK